MAHGLPADFRWEFESEGRNLSRLRFSRDHSSAALTLNVYVPEQAERFAVDQPILFSVLAYEPKAVDARGVGRGGSGPLASPRHWLRATAIGADGPG